MTKPLDSSSDTLSTSKNAWLSNKAKTAAGVAAVGALIFLSRPMMSYFTREMCYNSYGENSWWPNPIKGLAQSVISTYQCEWMGHYGFQWHEAVSFLSNSWQALLGTVGSGVGIYSFMKRGNPAAPVTPSPTRSCEQKSDDIESPRAQAPLTPLFQAIDKGTISVKNIQHLKDEQVEMVNTKVMKATRVA